MDKSTFVPAQPDPEGSTQLKAKINRGKGSKTRSSEKFRRTLGRKQNEEARQRIIARRGFTLDDEAEEVSKALESFHLPIVQRARPIPIATRGIGIAVSVEYMKMTTTWTFSAINDICTIHQYYRVSLYLLYAQCANARSTQCGPESYQISQPYYMDEQIRFYLDPILKMPICTASILSSIGKISVGSYEWHCFLPALTTEQMCNAELCYLYFQPKIARVILESLVAVNDDNREFVASFRDNCPIPGAQWDAVSGALTNIDEIWPAQYGPDQLRHDISCVQALIMRVANRLPKSFIQTISKDGTGNRGALVSMDPLDGLKVITTFVPPPSGSQSTTARTRKRCGADGEMIECVSYVARGRVSGVRVVYPASATDVWSPLDDAGKQEFLVGAGTLVGERAGPFSSNRLQITGVSFSYLPPLAVLHAMTEVQRP